MQSNIATSKQAIDMTVVFDTRTTENVIPGYLPVLNVEGLAIRGERLVTIDLESKRFWVHTENESLRPVRVNVVRMAKSSVAWDLHVILDDKGLLHNVSLVDKSAIASMINSKPITSGKHNGRRRHGSKGE